MTHTHDTTITKDTVNCAACRAHWYAAYLLKAARATERASGILRTMLERNEGNVADVAAEFGLAVRYLGEAAKVR